VIIQAALKDGKLYLAENANQIKRIRSDIKIYKTLSLSCQLDLKQIMDSEEQTSSPVPKTSAKSKDN